jgi:hypothetical protein
MHQYSKYSKYILNSLKHRVSFRDLRQPTSKGLLNVRTWTVIRNGMIHSIFLSNKHAKLIGVQYTDP